MNNKGFAITTVLYGTLLLFCLLLVSMLGILSTYKNNLDKLINAANGTRSIVTFKKPTECKSSDEIDKIGLYCVEEVLENDDIMKIYRYYPYTENISGNR